MAINKEGVAAANTTPTKANTGVSSAAKVQKNPQTQKELIYNFLLTVKSANRKEIGAATGVGDHSQSKWLSQLRKDGKIRYNVGKGAGKVSYYSANPDVWAEWEKAAAECSEADLFAELEKADEKKKAEQENAKQPDKSTEEQADTSADEQENDEEVEAPGSDVPMMHIPTYGIKNESTLRYIDEVADVKNCSRDMLLATALAAVGVCFRGKVTDGIFENGLSFYYCAIASASDTKTEGMAEITQPLWDIDKRVTEEYKKKEEEYAANKTNSEPIYHPLIVTQSTWEARTNALNANPHGVLNDGDEASAFLKRLNSYHSDGEVEELNGLWSKGRAKVIRSTQRPKIIYNANFSIVCNLQARMVKKVFSNEDWRSNGFLYRWMFTIQKERKYKRVDGKVINEQLKNDWKWLIEQIYYHPERTLKIEGEALNVYADWKNACEERCKEADKKGNERGANLVNVLRKLEIICERVAGCVHLINHETSDLISADTMRYACDIMNYFEYTQMAVFDMFFDADDYQISQAELVRLLDARYKIKERQKMLALADVLGRDKSQISRILK